jgi:hypothetical protein
VIGAGDLLETGGRVEHFRTVRARTPPLFNLFDNAIDGTIDDLHNHSLFRVFDVVGILVSIWYVLSYARMEKEIRKA